MPEPNGLAGRLADVRERISRAGADPAAITIIAVTKGKSLPACREAIAAGLGRLGENRVQEALSKIAALPRAEWHLIGHLQSNKVRQAAGRFSLIQSVDSIRLAEAIASSDPAQRILLQVNVSREPAKHGFTPEAVAEAARQIARLLPVEGLMAMGPAAGDPRPAFAEMAGLAERCRQATGLSLPVLSMGMSGDFEAAVEAGATMVRLGAALFSDHVR